VDSITDAVTFFSQPRKQQVVPQVACSALLLTPVDARDPVGGFRFLLPRLSTSRDSPPDPAPCRETPATPLLRRRIFPFICLGSQAENSPALEDVSPTTDTPCRPISFPSLTSLSVLTQQITSGKRIFIPHTSPCQQQLSYRPVRI